MSPEDEIAPFAIVEHDAAAHFWQQDDAIGQA